MIDDAALSLAELRATVNACPTKIASHEYELALEALIAGLEAENQRFKGQIPWAHPEIIDYVNELLANTPDEYDGEDAAPDIALRYLRDLEQRLAATEAVVKRLLEGETPSGWVVGPAEWCDYRATRVEPMSDAERQVLATLNEPSPE